MKHTGKGKYIVGVDLGGTKVLAALCTPRGQIMAREYLPTPATEGPEKGIESIAQAVAGVLSAGKGDASQFLGIGIGAAGIINPATGVVVTSPNLPRWNNVPLAEAIQERFQVPVLVNNDANAAAVGEHLFGGGRGSANLIYVTVSTGIGGGIILDNKLYSGASGAAGEIGHMTIETSGPLCGCGNRGCWEALASGKALARDAVQAVKERRETSILSLTEGNPDNITARVVAAAARQGDGMAQQLVARLAFYLGVGFANLVNIFNPSLILVGGGVSKMADLWLDRAKANMRERAFRVPADAVRIELAQLGDDAGVLGAMGLVLTSLSTGGFRDRPSKG